jgi:hypothetical protein
MQCNSYSVAQSIDHSIFHPHHLLIVVCARGRMRSNTNTLDRYKIKTVNSATGCTLPVPVSRLDKGGGRRYRSLLHTVTLFRLKLLLLNKGAT